MLEHRSEGTAGLATLSPPGFVTAEMRLANPTADVAPEEIFAGPRLTLGAAAPGIYDAVSQSAPYPSTGAVYLPEAHER